MLLFILFGFANLTQAQTKEEALEWLKTNSSLAYTPSITKSINSRARDPKEKPAQIVFVDETAVRLLDEWTDITLPFNEFLYEEDIDKIQKEYIKDDSYYSFGGAFWFILKLTNGRAIGYYTTPEKEADVKRVLKAIMHIAKLSGAKENKQIF